MCRLDANNAQAASGQRCSEVACVLPMQLMCISGLAGNLPVSCRCAKIAYTFGRSGLDRQLMRSDSLSGPLSADPAERAPGHRLRADRSTEAVLEVLMADLTEVADRIRGSRGDAL